MSAKGLSPLNSVRFRVLQHALQYKRDSVLTSTQTGRRVGMMVD